LPFFRRLARGQVFSFTLDWSIVPTGLIELVFNEGLFIVDSATEYHSDADAAALSSATATAEIEKSAASPRPTTNLVDAHAGLSTRRKSARPRQFMPRRQPREWRRAESLRRISHRRSHGVQVACEPQDPHVA